MAARKKSAKSAPTSAEALTQQNEGEISEDAGAVPDEDGNLFITEETAREIGAVDPESVRANQRMKDAVGQVRANKKGVKFSTDDLLEKYNFVVAQYTPNQIDIHVRRVTGTPITDTITSRPRNGTELHAALKKIHGIYEEAEYEVKFHDVNGKQYRGQGRIAIKSTLADAPPQGTNMHPYYPPGYPAPPPGYAYPFPPPQPQVAQEYPQAPTQQTAPQQPLPPQPQSPQPVPGLGIEELKKLFELFGSFQQAAPQAPPPMMMMPPPPPQPTLPPMPADPGQQLAWLSQAAELYKTMQAQQQQVPQYQMPPQYQAPPQYQPPMPPPPQQVAPAPAQPMDQMAMLTQMARLIKELQGPPQAPRGYGPPMGARPLPRRYAEEEYQGEEDQSQRPRFGGPPARGQRIPQEMEQQHPRTPRDQARSAMGQIREIVDAGHEIQQLFSGQQSTAAVPSHRTPDPGFDTEEEEDEDLPVRVMKAGESKIIFNKDDGKVRLFETAWANSDKILGWAGEQIQKISESQAQRQQQERRQAPPQLPQGYVQVTEGFRPPPGMVAVQVSPEEAQHVLNVQPSYPQPQPQQQQVYRAAPPSEPPLPPPPEDVPPPVMQAIQQPSRTPQSMSGMWGPTAEE